MKCLRIAGNCFCVLTDLIYYAILIVLAVTFWPVTMIWWGMRLAVRAETQGK
jgi:hypothetical protein